MLTLDYAKIRVLRERAGMSLTAAALAAGWGASGRTRWWKLEKGERGNVKLETVDAVARALKVPAKSLLIDVTP